MKLLLLLLALVLTGCSSTQGPASVTQEAAHQALVEVLRHASAGLDADDFSPLGLGDLLDEQSSHLADLQAIPLFEQRLQGWGEEVTLAFWHSANRLPPLLDPLFADLSFPDAKAMVADNRKSATHFLFDQHQSQIVELARTLLAEELGEAALLWSRIARRYQIVRNSRLLLEEEDLGPVTEDLFDHLLDLFIERYRMVLADEELQLRTTPVIKGSGSFLEVFQ